MLQSIDESAMTTETVIAWSAAAAVAATTRAAACPDTIRSRSFVPAVETAIQAAVSFVVGLYLPAGRRCFAKRND